MLNQDTRAGIAQQSNANATWGTTRVSATGCRTAHPENGGQWQLYPPPGLARLCDYDSSRSAILATILLVDDDTDSLAALQAVLELADYAVIPARSVREALDLLDQHPEIELVVSDIRMPEVDGLDFIRVLRHRFATLPTILMSGMPITDDDVVPREATRILTKPVAIGDLERAIAERLRTRPPADGRRPPGPASSPRKRS